MSRFTSGRPAWFVAVSGALLCLAPAIAEAAGCCGSQAAQADRLAPGEEWSVSLTEAFAHVTGGFDGSGAFRPIGAGQRDDELRSTLGAALRLSPDAQLFASAALVATLRRAGSLSSSALAPADLVFGARLDPAALPSWAFTAAVALPTGPTGLESSDPLGGDVTGRGAFGLRLGGAFERSFEEDFVLVSSSLTIWGPQRGTDTVAMLDATGGVLVGRAFASGLGLAAGGQVLAQAGTWTEAGRREASAWYLMRLQMVATWPWSSWSGTLGLFADPPFAGLREVARVGISLSVRRVGP